MKLSTKSIISCAILLASSLKSNAHPIELKGVNSVVHVSQEKVNNHSREEFIELPKEGFSIDVGPFGPIFDLVCQSDINDWCTSFPEQCSYVKTLCVKNEQDDYCAFDLYKLYEKVTNKGKKAMKSYMDMCDECLLSMANEFESISSDEIAIEEMQKLSEMCKVKLYIDNVIKSKNKGKDKDKEKDKEEKQEDEKKENIISTLASLVPSNNKVDGIRSRIHSKRNYGKIHSFKNPEVAGFVKSNGKIKYGNVGVNEKVNFSIHNKNIRSSSRSYKNKRQEDDEVMMMNIKDKINVALDNMKQLALQKVTNILNSLEINVNVLLQENLFINDPESTREKNVITDEILSSIKDILNNVEPSEEEEDAGIAGISEEETESAVVEEITENVEVPAELPPLPIIDIFDSINKVIKGDIPMNKKSESKTEADRDGIFEIDEEDPNYDVFIANGAKPTGTDAIVPTETGVPELEEVEENPTETVIPDVEEGEQGDDEIEDPPQSQPPKKPIIKPGKPSWPVKPGERPPFKPDHPKNPLKFGWPFKQNEPNQNGHGHGHGHGGIKPFNVIQTINKLFEITGEDQSNFNVAPNKRWVVKKNEYVVSNELLKGNEENEAVNNVGGKASIENHNEPSEENSIKLNNPDNHRDTDEEEVFEIGSKKVSWINSSHPNKPSLNFRETH